MTDAVAQLRTFAAAQLDELFAADDDPPAAQEREEAIDRWVRRLVEVPFSIPDAILDAMPEVSRHNEPQVAPQEYECGCVALTRITDRDGRTWLGYDGKPFEMRLALPCDGTACEIPHVRGTKGETP